MTARPPVIAKTLLWLCIPQSQQEALLGDLEEEFSSEILPCAGERAARQWYWDQALRSQVELLHMQRQYGELPLAALAAVFTAWLPQWMLWTMHSYVLSHIPLKEDNIVSIEFLITMFACMVVTVMAGGLACTALTQMSPLRVTFWLSIFAMIVCLSTQIICPHQHDIGVEAMSFIAIMIGAWAGPMLHRPVARKLAV